MRHELGSSEAELAESQRTVQALAKIAGRATGWSKNSGASRLVFQGSRFEDPKVKQLRQILDRNSNVIEVRLYDTIDTDAALQAVRSVEGIEELQIRNSDLSNKGLSLGF
jgi:hypothetical protein